MATNPREYHWILTLQVSGPSGPAGVTSGSGLITAGEGQTRESLYRQVFQHACDQSGLAPARCSVLFFDLAPNDL